MAPKAAGYSGTQLPKKLGIKPGTRGAVLGAPRHYFNLLGQTPDADLKPRLGKAMDFVHIFVRSRKDLEKRLPRILNGLVPAGTLWVSWPKKSSGVATDVTEDVIRDVVLPQGLVDVKVCAIDETWSGLKIVRRLENR